MADQLALLLRALQHPSADAPNRRAVVAWLENTKVRGLKPEERSGLTNLESPSWNDAFSSYLSSLECPVPFYGSNMEEVLLWLARHACHLEYADKAEALTPPPPKDARPGDSGGAAHSNGPAAPKSKQPPFSDCSSPEVEARARELLAILNIDSTDLALPDMLQAAETVLKTQVLPYLNMQQRREQQQQQELSASKKQPRQQPSVPSGSGSTAVDALRELPLGFTTGAPALDDACRLLRLLYVKDLRGLQSAIDDAIVAVQEFVANPRTDTSLGRIGS